MMLRAPTSWPTTSSGMVSLFFLRRYQPKSWLGDFVSARSSALRSLSLLQAKHLEPVHAISGFSTTTKEAFASSSNNSTTGPKVFVKYAVYKGKGALRISPGHPTFRTLDGGNLALDKEGCIFLEFAPAIGQRQYDWNRKQTFALSVVELGSLISLEPSESVELFHDPYMGSNNAGKVRKSLKVEAKPDRSGYFFSLSVVDSVARVDERLMVPLSKSEMAVMRSTFNFIIPYLMGWHAFAQSMSAISHHDAISETPTKYGANSLWDD